MLSGIEYMHSKNIAHRNLKQDHIRIDECCNIKIDELYKSYQFDINDNELLPEKEKGRKQKEQEQDQKVNGDNEENAGTKDSKEDANHKQPLYDSG